MSSADDHNVYVDGGIVQGNPSLKKICLVFTATDKCDGAEAFIKTLDKYRVKASFFFTGSFFEAFLYVVEKLLAHGHEVGSHSYGHLQYMPWSDRDSLLVTKEQFTADMLKSYEVMSKYGITKQKMPYFIPPYEYYNSTIASWARELGCKSSTSHLAHCPMVTTLARTWMVDDITATSISSTA